MESKEMLKQAIEVYCSCKALFKSSCENCPLTFPNKCGQESVCGHLTQAEVLLKKQQALIGKAKSEDTL